MHMAELGNESVHARHGSIAGGFACCCVPFCHSSSPEYSSVSSHSSSPSSSPLSSLASSSVSSHSSSHSSSSISLCTLWGLVDCRGFEAPAADRGKSVP